MPNIPDTEAILLATAAPLLPITLPDAVVASDDVREALRCAIRCTQFAVACLDPIATPRWPHAELRRLGELVPRLPLPPEMMDLGPILTDFAAEAAFWEAHRKAGTAEAALRAQNAANPPRAIPGDPVPTGRARVRKKASKRPQKKLQKKPSKRRAEPAKRSARDTKNRR